MYVVSCMLYVVRCMLYVVCCMLYVVCCMLYVCVCVYVQFVYLSVCMCVCMFVCMYVCMYACMHLCMYVWMYVCFMYVSMYSYVYHRRWKNNPLKNTFFAYFIPKKLCTFENIEKLNLRGISLLCTYYCIFLRLGDDFLGHFSCIFTTFEIP